MTVTDQQRLQILTAPGGAFPLREQIINGVPCQVFDREPRTLRDAFASLGQWGDRLAIGYQSEHWTYDDLWSEMTAVAHALQRDFGIGSGDRVGIAMRNYPEFVMAFGAIQLIGAVATTFNAWLKGHELAEQILQSHPRVLFADKQRIALSQQFGVAETTRLIAVRCKEIDGVVSYAHLTDGRRPASESSAPAVVVNPEDPSTVLFTSGTTGRPKAAVHSHLNHSASLLNKFIRAVSIDVPDDGGPAQVGPAPQSCKLVTFPFFHIAGINTMYNSLYAGHSLILMYKWDAEEAVRLVAEERVTELSGPPFISQTFLEAAGSTQFDLSSLRALGMGGAAAPLGVIEHLRAVLGDKVVPRTGYGMTETTSTMVAISGDDLVRRPSSVGCLLPTAEITFFDTDGLPVSVGEVGEVGFRGAQVITGYENVDDDTSFRDGWFLTGDIGRMDEDGFVYLVGRVKDIVIRGGENISCAEVEGCLGSYPGVIEAVVLGAPHPMLGEEVVAIAHVAAASTITDRDLREYVAGRLASFKVPARIALIHEHLPRTASGKIVKRELGEQLDIGSLLHPVAP